MKISEMNGHEKMIYSLVCEVMSEMIGGAENSLQDYSPEDEDYKEAEAFLNQGHEGLKKDIYEEVMARCGKGTYANHARFAGKDFTMERIERKLTKWGY